MRKNWTRKLSAFLLAALVFSMMGTMAFATETSSDPEKDLVIGSEYGGGGSPGEEAVDGSGGEDSSDPFGEPGRLVLEGDPLWDDVQAIVDAENSAEGSYTGSDAVSGDVYVRYGQNPVYYDDGSWGIDVKIQNGSGKDIVLDWSMTPTDSHGSLLDVLDMGSYINNKTIRHGYIRNFRIVFSGRPAVVESEIGLADDAGELYDPVKFTMKDGNVGTAYSMVTNPYPEDHPIWSTMETVSGEPCEDCGVEPSDEISDDVNQANHIILVCVLVCLLVVVGVLLIIYLRHKNKK